MTHPYLPPSPHPRVLAHRGLVTAEAGTEGIVENSFAAIAAAEAAGAHYVESDCHVTADGVVVLFHDADLQRVVGDPRGIHEVGAAELEELMSERGGLITLRQAMEAFPRTRFNLDVKAGAAALPLGRMVVTHSDRVLVTSFSDDNRRDALAAADAAGASPLPATSPGRSTMLRLLGAVSLGAHGAASRLLAPLDALQIPERQGPIRVLTPRLLDLAHENEVEVHVWTVNDEADMVRLAEMGVDGIVTDRADVALRLFP